jgi:mannose-6-phosphate isomerase-like protein (cupin superfamily)
LTVEPESDKANEPIARTREEGQAWWWFNSLAVVKASSKETGGQFTVLEVTDPPHEATPLHVHHREDESFFVLDGGATFVIGDATVEAGPGDFLYGPRGIPHRYTTGAEGCRLLFILTPGGFDEMVTQMSTPAERRELPPPSEDEPDWERIASLAAAYGNEILE